MPSPDRTPAARRAWPAPARLLGLVGLALLAPGATARAADWPGGAAPCDLAVEASPARLAAGAPRAVLVRVRAAAGRAPGAAPRLLASEGRLEGPRPDGDGWAWTWQAPAAGVPRVALLGALGEGGTCGRAAVPLDGVGDAEVRTRPGAVVEVRIAERTFGPARADATGLALVPVEVPPGVDAVFHGARRIPLPLPPVAHVAAFLELAAAPADREVVVGVLLAAVEPGGAPLAGPAPALAADAGALGPAVAAGPGVWRVVWRLPPGPAGPAALTTQLPGEPAARATLERVAGPAAAVRLSLDGPSAMAGQSRPVTAAVTVADAAGNPVDGPVAASADAGEVGDAVRAGPGDYRLHWTVPARLEGRRAALLTVRTGAATATAALTLRPAGPARLSLSAAAPVVTADGAAAVDLLASVTDAHGNPVDEPPTRRAAGAGEVGPPRQAGPGRFLVAYRPRAVSGPGEDEVVVELPPLAARARLRLRPPLPPLTLSAGLGAALGQGRWLGLQAGAEVSGWAWLGSEEAGASLAAAFTRLRDDATAASGTATVPFAGEVRTVALLASAGWRRSAGRDLSLRLAAGGGAARVESLVAAGGGPLLPEAAWVPAASGAAAAGWRLGPGRAVVEARFTWLGDAGLGSLQGSPSPLSLTLGYEIDAP